MSLDQVWNIFSEELYWLHHAFDVEIHLFVLMGNHFHLVISTPNANISKAMAAFMKSVSIRITRPIGRINQTFGTRHYPCVLTSAHYYLNTYKYFYRNPVEAGAVTRVEEYRYSTLPGLLGAQPLLIPLVEDTTLFSDIEGTIRWLNEAPNPDHQLDMKNALRHRTFQLRLTDARKPHVLETRLL